MNGNANFINNFGFYSKLFNYFIFPCVLQIVIIKAENYCIVASCIYLKNASIQLIGFLYCYTEYFFLVPSR